ncbi:Hypothetical predicted protein [Marmota monax]|uniref:Glucosamine-6-phosphate deaminase n=1 Tax=Marmota monax TaxID=9995 RepID=A0A5E4D5B0_MARMO|nr:hypothetical protein GHT09_012789 [Marmota monax]VTJ89325.1 Hypothetical predicted protein [Marmota monax]
MPLSRRSKLQAGLNCLLEASALMDILLSMSQVPAWCPVFVKTLSMDTTLANARFFDGDLAKVPTMALTVGVGTVMDAREVMILITGIHKTFALNKAIEEGVNHMWTVSAFQQHPYTVFVCDEDATLELKVKTVKYFKGLMLVHNKLVDPLYSIKEKEIEKSQSSKKPYSD